PGSSAGCPTFYGDQTVISHTTWNEAIHDPRQPGPYFNAYGNQFFGGDLKGIQDKLDYLQSLGIDTLYLTPIFTARSNHRYDTDDYLTVDPALGGDAALASLVQELDQRGMHLILDGVFNHTSSDSLYFDRYHRYPSEGACESLGSTYRSWFVFFNNDAPCDSADYEGWFGFDSLAVLQDGSTEVRDFVYRTPGANVVEYWYDQGASGWRFDVANEISHNWWRDFRSYAKSYKADGPLVGEIWPDASQFLAGDQLDSTMSYRFRKNVLGFARGSAGWGDNDNNGNNQIVALSPSQFDRALRAVREDYPPQASAAMLNLIDSHDTNRALYVLTLLGDSGLAQAKERLKLTALFQFTYLGAPMVYYGDEAGLDSPSLANGPNGPEDDPYNRAPY
ncbi:MAG: glycoside hydrolase family 13 protein, partial [Anaerolineales bacterium]